MVGRRRTATYPLCNFERELTSLKEKLSQSWSINYENDRLLVFEIIGDGLVWEYWSLKFESLMWPICLLLYHLSIFALGCHPYICVFFGVLTVISVILTISIKVVVSEAGITRHILCHHRQNLSNFKLQILHPNRPLFLSTAP